MSGNDLQAQMSADVSKLLAGMGQVDNQLKQLARSTKENNRASQEFQRASTEAFGKSKEHAESFFAEITHGSHALKLLGGPVAEVSHKVGFLSSLVTRGGAAFGILGAGAAVAGVAIEAYGYAVEKSAERTKRAEEIAAKYHETIAKGKEQSKQNALGGLSDAESRKKLTALGGQSAVHQADDLAKELGISVQSARKGLIGSYKIADPEHRKNAVEAARIATQSGLVNFDDAVTGVSSSSPVLGAVRGGKVHRAAALLTEKATTGRFRGGNEDRLRDETDNVLSDRFSTAASDATRQQNALQEVKEGQVANGEAAEAIGEEVAKAMDPLKKAIEALTLSLFKEARSLGGKKQDEFLDQVRSGNNTAITDADIYRLRHVGEGGR